MVLQPGDCLRPGCGVSLSLLETSQDGIASSKKGIGILNFNFRRLRMMVGTVTIACLLWAVAFAIANKVNPVENTEADGGSLEDHVEKMYRAEGNKHPLYVPRRLASGNHHGSWANIILGVFILGAFILAITVGSWFKWSSLRQMFGADRGYQSLQSTDDFLYAQGVTTARIAVMGSVGVGKSQLLNALVGANAFEAPRQAESVTQETVAKEFNVKLYGSAEAVSVRLIDTPGVEDVDGALVTQYHRTQMFEMLREEGIINAFILVLNYQAPRLTQVMTEFLLEAFGEDLFDYLFLVFTHYSANEDDDTDQADKQTAIDDWTMQLSARCGLRVGHKFKCFFVDSIDALRDDEAIRTMKANGTDLVAVGQAAAWERLKSTSLKELSRILQDAENNARCNKRYVTKQMGAPRLVGFDFNLMEWYIDEQLPDRACILQVMGAVPRYSKLTVLGKSEGVRELQVKPTEDLMFWQLVLEKVPYFDTSIESIEVEVANKGADPDRATLSFDNLSVVYRPERRSALLGELGWILQETLAKCPDDLHEHEAHQILSEHVRERLIHPNSVREPSILRKIDADVQVAAYTYMEEQRLKSQGCCGVVRVFERRHRIIFWLFAITILFTVLFEWRLAVWIRAGGDCPQLSCQSIGLVHKSQPGICSVTHFSTHMSVLDIPKAVLFPNCSEEHCCHRRVCLCDHGTPAEPSSCSHLGDHKCVACSEHLHLAHGNTTCIPDRGYKWAVVETGHGTRIKVVVPKIKRVDLKGKCKTIGNHSYNCIVEVCPQNYPKCSPNKDCVIHGGQPPWTKAADPQSDPGSGGYNYIDGYDGIGTNCLGDYQGATCPRNYPVCGSDRNCVTLGAQHPWVQATHSHIDPGSRGYNYIYGYNGHGDACLSHYERVCSNRVLVSNARHDQTAKNGLFTITSGVRQSRPIYRKTTTITAEYLFFTNGKWYIGPEVAVEKAGVRSTKDTACPSNAGPWKWRTYRSRRRDWIGSVHVSTLIKVYTSLDEADVHAEHTSGQFFLYCMKNGRVWAAGRNNFGQLGDGTTRDQLRPKKVMDGIRAVSMGWGFSLFLAKKSGIVYGVGRNTSGQLKLLNVGAVESFISREVVQRPIILGKDVVQVSAARNYSWFLKADGTLLSSLPEHEGGGVIHNSVRQISAKDPWPMYLTRSSAAFAQIRLFSHPQLSPFRMKLADGVAQVANDRGVNLVLKRDGRVWGWIHPSCKGNGKISQMLLFNQSQTTLNKFHRDFQKQFKASMTLLFKGVRQVAAGPCYAIALKRDGQILVAGNNSKLQLGVNHDFVNWSSPMKVPKLESARDIFAGDGFSVFTMESGSILASGTNSFGLFGDGSKFNRRKPDGCNISTDMASADNLGIRLGHMPREICQFCNRGHYVNATLCVPCPATLVSRNVIRNLSGCTPCPSGSEPTLLQDDCVISAKWIFLRDQFPYMIKFMIAYIAVVAAAYGCKTFLAYIGYYRYQAFADEHTFFVIDRLKSRIWRVLGLMQPLKWPWWFQGGFDVGDWSALLSWFLMSTSPPGTLADFEADYILAVTTTFLLYIGPLIPLLLWIFPRPLYICVQIVYDITELYVVNRSHFHTNFWVYALNILFTIADLALFKGPEAVDLVFHENVPGMTFLLDWIHPEGRDLKTVLVRPAAKNQHEIVVDQADGLQAGDLIQIAGVQAQEEHKVTRVTIEGNKQIVITLAPLEADFPVQSFVKRTRKAYEAFEQDQA